MSSWKEETIKSWKEQLESLVEDPPIQYTPDGFRPVPVVTPVSVATSVTSNNNEDGDDGFDMKVEKESVKDQVKGFLKATGEMLSELGKGVGDVVRQSMGDEECYVAREFSGKWKKVEKRLRWMNEYLPEDRDPAHAWPVVFFVFFVALAVLCVNTEPSRIPKVVPKEVLIHPLSASHVYLPDGRRMAYHEQGVTVDKARYSIIVPHSFLSSRLAGIPGVKGSLLTEYGVRLITYDLPGFGESEPHPSRNLNSSALDMSNVADALGVVDKFWVLGYSSGGMHAWAALRYIPDRLAGAAMFAPIVNPYDSSMSKEEQTRTWEKWTRKKKFMYFVARRFPRYLSYFYRGTFLSGKHGQLDKWLSLSLGQKDENLIEKPTFEEFWQRDVEESIRQGSPKPFIEEASLQVSNWGFSLGDILVQRRLQGKGFLSWLRSLYTPVKVEWAGFLGPIHIWQGMDDTIVAPSTVEFVHRLVPGATIHKLPGEGHYSYFYFCDECHRHIFFTLFGIPRGPLETITVVDQTPLIEEELKGDSLIISTMDL